ncbi:hypothetical protein GCM10011328_34940 [Hafnia psychrotolerans]|uniref:VENN motif-containing domain-containing protein n=1 Tax=Hafnia psychrotolerans TaxID=1477018 RepID=A0ABQ1H3F9_9GAMM|nr:hypothetical protein GCM10011328_34940 [Hafnia psychrotolerans]
MATHSGDIAIGGSQLKAGGNTSLNAANDILLTGAANTQESTGKNSSSGGGVGISFGVGNGSAGLSIFASVNGAKGNDKGNGTNWSETTLDSGGNVILSSGRDTSLSGAQVNGEKVTVDAGRDLTITSLQDSDDYKSKQTSFGAGGSFTFGSMSGSGYINLSQDKMNSTYDSVVEQSGIYAGKGGFDINVGSHTQLNGGVIASQGTADENLLNTGTLGFSDIGNKADYKVSHSGISLSGGNGASAMSNAMSNVGNVLAGLNGQGHAEGTTQSAVANGTLIVRDAANQQQNVGDLSRDTDHANGSISPVFDKEKEQKRLQASQLVGEIGAQVMDIARTQGDLNGLSEAKKKYPEKSAKELRETDVYKAEMAKYGTGSAIQQGLQAATAAIQGLAGGDLAKAIAGASAPYLAEVIKQVAPDESSRVMAHAVVAGALAAVQGNSAAAGAAGAATTALMGEAIKNALYGDIPVSQLSEEQKQTLVTLGTAAAGLAGGLTGGSSADAMTGAQAGQNEISNNMTSIGAVQQMQAWALMNSAAAAEAGSVNPNDQAALALTKAAKQGLSAACLANTSCVMMAIITAQSQSDSDKGSTPNIGKDLSDADKAELGGTGSGTGTPPPPENDPKQQSEKPAENLNQKQESAIKKIDNTIKNALKDHDITGTLKDMDGNPVPKEDGGYWDHMQEMQNTLRGLRNHADTLKNVNNPEAQAAYGRATDAINKIESALKGHGI